MAVVVSGAIFRSLKQGLKHDVSIIELRKSKDQFVGGVQWKCVCGTTQLRLRSG